MAGDRGSEANSGQGEAEQRARASGLEELIVELSHVRESLAMFPAAWQGASAMHREATRIDALVERLQRASGLSPEFVQAATTRFAMLLENGATPQIAMHMILRDALTRRMVPGGTTTPAASAAPTRAVAA